MKLKASDLIIGKVMVSSDSGHEELHVYAPKLGAVTMFWPSRLTYEGARFTFYRNALLNEEEKERFGGHAIYERSVPERQRRQAEWDKMLSGMINRMARNLELPRESLCMEPGSRTYGHPWVIGLRMQDGCLRTFLTATSKKDLYEAAYAFNVGIETAARLKEEK